MEIYERIKQRRLALGMTQDELAAKLGYKSRSTIARIELGENDITRSKIVAFAKALEVDLGIYWAQHPQKIHLRQSLMHTTNLVLQRNSALVNISRIYFQIPKTCGTNKGGVLILDSERLELLNEDAQVDLYLFILGILAAEETAATA